MILRSLRSIIAIVAVGVVLFGCESEEFQISEDGYEYKYIVKGDGEVPKDGEVVFYNMKFMNEKDSVIQESTTEQPLVLQCNDQQWASMGALYKALKMVKIGDSILIKIPTKSVYSESFGQAVPPGLDPEGTITFCMGLSKIMNEEEVMAQRLEDIQLRQNEIIQMSMDKINSDAAVIDEFLAKNNITAQSTETGLRYVIESEGTGNYPEPGDNVTVHYNGTLLDGTKFDSSIEKGQPFQFQLGMGNVIMGWDLGIPLLKVGGKGTIYVPSPLAYGEQNRGDVIQANSILKFDVELIGIN